MRIQRRQPDTQLLAKGRACLLLLTVALLAIGCSGSGSSSSDAGLADAANSLTALAVTPLNASIAKGSQLAFTATGTYMDGSSQDLSALVTWTAASSGGATVLTVDQSGLATGVALGTATLSASYQGLTTSVPVQVVRPPVSTVSILPLKPVIAQRTVQQFMATATYADNTTQDITSVATWTSTDLSGANVATISAAGLATAAGPGLAGITVSYQGKSAATPLQVTSATLSSVNITPADSLLPKNLGVQLRAIATFSDGTTQDVTPLATWTAKDLIGSGVVALAQSGLATGKTPGKATITAVVLGSTASTSISVLDATVTALTITGSVPTLVKNTTGQLAATATFSDGSMQDVTTAVTWTASDVMGSGVASVNASGLVTGTAPGKATIAAAYGGQSASVPLQVLPVTATSITLTPNNPVIARMTARQFTAIATLSDNTTQDITTLATWSSNDLMGTAVATINSSGLATGRNPGTATIGVLYMNKSASTVLQVTAATLSSLALNPVNPLLPEGLGLQFKAVGTFSDGSKQDLTQISTWTASDVMGTGVATVSAGGLVTGKTPGKASISAVTLGQTAATTVTVINATLSSLTVTPSSATVYQKVSQSFVATATYSDGSMQDVSSTAAWTTLDAMGNGVASINASGQATGLTVGQASILATYSGRTASATLNVLATPPPPSLASISPMYGANSGGITLTLTGSQFVPGDTVNVAGIPATNVVVSSSTQITATLPAKPGALGPVPVAVLHPDGQSSTRTDLFVYYAGMLGLGAHKEYASGTSPSSIAVGDFNADNKLDLVTADSSSNTVSVFLGKGDGTFGAATAFAVGTGPSSVVVGDLDNDKKLDLVVANFTASSISVLKGKGDGTFAAAITSTTPSAPYGLALADLNNDKKLDLVSANPMANNASVRLGDGAGGFAAPVNYAVDAYPVAVAVGDLQGDKIPDLAVASKNVGSVDVLKGSGDGTFVSYGRVGGNLVLSVAISPFAYPGHFDYLVSDILATDVGPPSVTVSQFDNLVAKRYSTYTAMSDQPLTATFGDVNGDGRPDIVAGVQDGKDSVYVLLNNGSGYDSPVSYTVAQSPVALAIGDFNGDGLQDIAAAASTSNSISVLLNTSK